MNLGLLENDTRNMVEAFVFKKNLIDRHLTEIGILTCRFTFLPY
jgi:hypothetical protein